MPTVLLSAGQTDDAHLLWRACIAREVDVIRVHGWQMRALPASDGFIDEGTSVRATHRSTASNQSVPAWKTRRNAAYISPRPFLVAENRAKPKNPRTAHNLTG